MKKKYFIIIIIFCFVMLVNISQVRAEEVSDRDLGIAAAMAYGDFKAGKTVKESLGDSPRMIYQYGSKHELDDWFVVDASNPATNLGLSAYTLQKGNNLIIAFRGTDTEILTDAASGITNFHVQEIFSNAYVDRIMNEYSKKEGNYKIYVTGHSLGGLLAQTAGARIEQRASKYGNIELAKIVDFDSMGLNFIPILAILRTITINTLKQLGNEGRLVEYCTFGDIISAGGIHYGEFRTVLPSIDSIVDYRNENIVFDTIQKTIKISNILAKIIEAEKLINLFKTDIDKARDLYQVDSILSFLNLVHGTNEFAALNCDEAGHDVFVKINDSSGNEIANEITIDGNTTIEARTHYASVKTYKWYVSDDGQNWGEPIKVSSLYEASTVKVPTNTLEINDLETNETKYYKVEAYYDDKYVASKYELLKNRYVDLQEQPNDFNSGVVEKVIKVTQTNGEKGGSSILGGNFKLLDLLMNINKMGLFEKLFSLFDGLFMKK